MLCQWFIFYIGFYNAGMNSKNISEYWGFLKILGDGEPKTENNNSWKFFGMMTQMKQWYDQ